MDRRGDYRARTERAGFRVDYVSVRRREDLSIPGPGDRELIILAATWLGGTRLIDNRKVDLDEPPKE